MYDGTHNNCCALLYSQKIWWGIKFGSLAICLSNHQIKNPPKFLTHIYTYAHVLGIYVWQSCTEPPNLNLPIHLKGQFGTQPPNLIPANISGCMVCHVIVLNTIVHVQVQV